jgi:hypothetical protein
MASNPQPPEPTPPTVTVSTVVIKRDDKPKYIYSPVKPLG